MPILNPPKVRFDSTVYRGFFEQLPPVGNKVLIHDIQSLVRTLVDGVKGYFHFFNFENMRCHSSLPAHQRELILRCQRANPEKWSFHGHDGAVAYDPNCGYQSTTSFLTSLVPARPAATKCSTAFPENPDSFQVAYERLTDQILGGKMSDREPGAVGRACGTLPS